MLCFPKQQATDDGKVTDIPAEIWEALVSVGICSSWKKICAPANLVDVSGLLFFFAFCSV